MLGVSILVSPHQHYYHLINIASSSVLYSCFVVVIVAFVYVCVCACVYVCVHVSVSVCVCVCLCMFVMMFNAYHNWGCISFYTDSGRSSSEATLSRVGADRFNKTTMFPPCHGHAVTVPGAAAAWIDTVQHFGSGKVVTFLHMTLLSGVC